MKKTILFAGLAMGIIAAAAFLSSCSKDQKLARQLDGTWKVDKIIKGTIEITDSLPTISFTKCKRVKKNFCPGSWKSNNGSSQEFTWAIGDKGTTFFLDASLVDLNLYDLVNATREVADYSGEHDIKENSKTKFVITSKVCAICETDNTVVTIEMSKQ